MSASQESIKAIILSEIEEGQSQLLSRPQRIQDEILSLCSDRNLKFSTEAIQKAILNGIDPRFFRAQSKKSPSTSNSGSKTKATEETLLDEQFELFLSIFDSFDEELLSSEDDSDYSSKDRILALKLPANAFDPLMVILKERRPVLYQSLSQHPLISGKMKFKKRPSRRNRKKDKKEREEKEGKDQADKIQAVEGNLDFRNKTATETKDNKKIKSPSHQDLDWESYRQVLSVIICKSIADGTVQGQLIAIAVLLYVLKERSSEENLTIPLGGVIASLFEGLKKYKDDKLISSILKDVVHSPFDVFLRHPIPSDTRKDKPYFRSEVGDGGDEGQGTEEASQYGFQSEEAGSTIGSSTLAEQGTETASIGDSAEMDEELTEDELLAQALALSLVGQPVTSVAQASTAEETIESIPSASDHQDEGISRPDESTSSTSTNILTSNLPHISLSHKMLREKAEKEENDRMQYLSSKRAADVREKTIIINQIPDKFAPLPPLSTFGPFCDSRLWQVTDIANESFAGEESAIKSIPLKHVVIALLINITVSAESYLGEDPIPLTGYTATSTIGNEEGINVEKKINKPPICPPLTIAPHILTFLLLEDLLQLLIGELKKSSEIALSFPGITSNSGSGNASSNVVSQSSSKDFYDFHSVMEPLVNETESKIESKTEVDYGNWNFHRYFLLWSLSSLLKTLRANLSFVESSPIPPTSLGLGIVDNDRTETDSFPFVLQLLQRISECIGSEAAPIRCDNVVDVALLGLGMEKIRITPGYTMLQSVHSDRAYRHHLRIAAIETYVAGLSVFYPSVERRERLVKTLLLKSPLSAMAGLQLGLSGSRNVGFNVTDDRTQQSTNDVLLPRSPDYYRLYLLQRVCLAAADGDLILHPLKNLKSSKTAPSSKPAPDPPSFLSQYQFTVGESPSNFTRTRPYDPYSPRNAPLSTSTHSLSPIRPEGRRDTKSMHALLHDTIYDSTVDASSSTLSLESILISRLSQHDIMLGFHNHTNAIGDTKKLLLTEAHCAFAGELELLRMIQQRYISLLTSGPSSSTSQTDIYFNTKKCNISIGLSNDDRTAIQRSPKCWGSVIAATSFEPNTGSYEWSVIMDKCDKGDIFVGICTSEFSIETYVGGDKHSWGMIGTRSLWHNQTKIKSEYGSSFGTLSVVVVTLDTDKGTLSYCIDGKDAGLAFEGLPKETLYPAIGLYFKEDQTTLLTTSKVTLDSPSKNTSATPTASSTSNLLPAAKRLGGREQLALTLSIFLPFIRYSKTIFDIVLGIIKAAEGMDDAVKRRAALSHPFIGMLLPSLAAAIIGSKMTTHTSSQISLELLPILTVLTKRLSALHDRHGKDLNATTTSNAGKDTSGFIGSIQGVWKIKSSAAGSVISAQEYRLRIDESSESGNMDADAEEENETEEEEDDRNGKSSNEKIVKFSGKGMGDTSAMTVKGILYGTRIKFQENWSMGGTCVVDGRMSLDGTFFSGTFRDTKTSTVGNLEGFNTSYEHYLNPKNTLLKVSLLAAMAFAKLASLLIIGLEAVTVMVDEADINDTNDNEESTSLTSNNPAEDNEDEKAEVWDESIEQQLQSEGSVDPFQTGINHTDHKAFRNCVTAWLQSMLFSGGLPLNSTLRSQLRFELELYLKKEELPASPTSSTTFEQQQQQSSSTSSTSALQRWWLEQTFGTIFTDPSQLTTQTFSGDFTDELVMISPSSPTSALHPFLQDMLVGKGRAKKLDDYIINHTGQSGLSKIGGEPMQSARRSVLVVLIYHSGVLLVCDTEESDLATGKKSAETRPNEMLIDVWRSAQRVIENVIWKKQQSGSSYMNVAQDIFKKTDLLLSILPSENAIELSKSLQYSYADSQLQVSTDHRNGSNSTTGGSPNIIGQYFSRMMAECVEFLISTVRFVSALKGELIRASLRGMSRLAGFRAFYLLFSKVERVPQSVGNLPALSATVQPAAVEYILPALLGMVDIKDRGGGTSPRSLPSESLLFFTAIGSSSTSSSQLDTSATSSQYGHYFDGLRGCSFNIMTDLKRTVEDVYTQITTLLQRCTWSKDRDGQCVALTSWGLNIQPEDHEFLNKVCIFKVLQSVMEGVRDSMSTTIPLQTVKSASETVDPRKSFLAEIFTFSNKRLAQLVLRIVHALAAQVAFTKAPMKFLSCPIKLQRVSQSGPPTLSQALFDMLFSEVFYGFRKIISDVILTNAGKKSETSEMKELNSPLAEAVHEEFLDGEVYVYRILRLLYSVSSATICQSYLSSPKWITLLLSAVGYGGFAIQRRLLRLLRRLLASGNPEQISGYVSFLLTSRPIIMDLESSFNDENALAILSNDFANRSKDISQSTFFVEKMVRLFLEGVSTVIPPTNDLDPSAVKLLQHLKAEANELSLSSESVSILRQLHEVPYWREAISSAFQSNLTWVNDAGSEKWNQAESLRLAAATVSVLGGFVDRLRPGCLVLLRPFSLAGMSESFALRLAAASHSCGMIVSRTPSSKSVEVVLMERGRKSPRSNGSSPTGTPSGIVSAQQGVISSTTSSGAGYIPANTPPVRAVKMNDDDVLPTWDVAVSVENIPLTLFEKFLNLLDNRCLPWIQRIIDTEGEGVTNNDVEKPVKSKAETSNDLANNDQEDDDDDMQDEKEEDEEIEEKEEDPLNEETHKKYSKQSSTTPASSTTTMTEVEALQCYLYTSTFHSIANSMQCDNLAAITSLSPRRLYDILTLAVTESNCGGLCVIEVIEQRWAILWDTYSTMVYNDISGKIATPSVSNESKGKASSDTGRSSSFKALSSFRGNVSSSPQITSSGGISATSAAVSALMSSTSRLDAAVTAASMNILNSLAAPVGIDPNVARRHMMEMGFPKEWCEVALRRCRYNVEMAINLCFEHGTDMDQLVAEDAALMSEQSTRSQSSSRRAGRGGESNDFHRSAGGGAPTGYGRSTRGSVTDTAVLMKQLLEMGFPPSWCTKALDVNQNNVDAALTWILSHGEELVDEETETELNVDQDPGGDKPEDSRGPNPLVAVSGMATINPDLTCAMAATSGFPSVGCRGFGVSSGKWYYEVTLLTAGCIQIGWVDGAYEGCAENGEGVGDDAHSWAFDGWRVYLWHETLAEWGAKWAPGDVLGCALDLDSRVMSFYLNGYGVEVGMGPSFKDFSFYGGMYPCASFNRNERIQFNFGSTPFKHGPPTGYYGFIDHVMYVFETSNDIYDALSWDDFLGRFRSSRNSPDNLIIATDEMISQHIVAEDALEEQRGEGDFLWQRRYFQPDESRATNVMTTRLPTAQLSSAIPSNKSTLLTQFLSLSKDLSILYCRQIILRILAAFPNFISSTQKTIHDLMLSNDEGVNNEQKSEKVKDNELALTGFGDMLLVLFRLCSVSSSRTKIYLQTTSILSSSHAIPANLGSVLSVGGAPMLHALQHAMSTLLRNTRAAGSTSFLECLLHHVRLDTNLATRRDFVVNWRLDSGFCPAIYKDGTLSDTYALTQPSLNLSVWITLILIDQCAHELEDVSEDAKELVYDRVLEWMVELCRSWSFALRSSSMSVKICAMRLLLVMLQEAGIPGSRFYGRINVLLESMVAELPVDRLDDLVIKRLNQERGSFPICSEYLQTMLELVVSVRQLCPEAQSAYYESPTEVVEEENAKIISSESMYLNTIPILPVSDEEGSDVTSGYNWEAQSGLILSDDGWDTWTGSVNQLLATWPDKPIPPDKLPDNSPELMPGCSVMKIVTRPPREEVVEPSAESCTVRVGMEGGDLFFGESESEPSPSALPDTSTPPIIASTTATTTSTSTTATGVGRSFRATKSPAKKTTSGDLEEDVQIGTVVKISTWPGCSAGSSRIIKWDETGVEEEVRWGAHGMYDVFHIQRNKQGKVLVKFSKPVSEVTKLVKNGFGSAKFFGVILRIRKNIRHQSDEPNIASRFDGVMEWPDFCAVVYIRGIRWMDGNMSFTEEKLLSGPMHSGWQIRFASSSWKPGTTYELNPSRTQTDASLTGRNATLCGQFSYQVDVGLNKVAVSGDIRLQKNVLFSFDDKACGSSISVSNDKLAVSTTQPEGRPCVYGNVGFSSGVHYWEFKIDQADLGSVFVGVAEKAPLGTSSSVKLNRWQGLGAINIRLSFRANAGNGSGSGTERFYGDHFHTGDTIGVLLDMNRGRLSFYLDGMKYGEHTLADLGEAFDGLTGTTAKVRPRTYFPIVGFRKIGDRAGDRVALTGRWVSCIGPFQSQILDMVQKAWGLLSTWSVDKPPVVSLDKSHWLCREAWRDWLRWRSGRFVKVKTRCKTPTLLITVDTSPRACVDASIRLGLSQALFRGDRICFGKSCGRPLETKEEAVILGAYSGLLWYKLDSQQGSGNLQESASTAWCLSIFDIEGISLLRRATGENTLPTALINLELPRIPIFHGGRLRVVYDGGAVIRDGIEIDTSDVIGNAEHNLILYATERRINSSNIARYRVLYKGVFGWISENIRGGTEEAMVTRITGDDPIAVAAAKKETFEAANALNAGFRVMWHDVSSMELAMGYWEKLVEQQESDINLKAYLHPGVLSVEGNQNSNSANNGDEPLSTYENLITSMKDGSQQVWTVEADMKLVELMTSIAVANGISPQNLSCVQLRDAILSQDSSWNSVLKGVDPERAIARASLLRVLNTVVGHALPYMSLNLPEEKWKLDRLGVTDEYDVVSKPLPAKPVVEPLQIQLQNRNEIGLNSETILTPAIYNARFSEDTWHSPCNARRLRSLRRLLFDSTKRMFWEGVLEATTSPTSLQQDEYEDPKELKTIKVNRVKATQSRLASIANPVDRLRQSVYGQLHKEMRTWPSSSFRRSYLGKGHGGQRRAFKVKFTGEGVNDYGGPYRAVFEQVVDELQADSAITASSGKPWEKCLLPLLCPCGNRVSGVGPNQDKYVLSPAPCSPMTQELMQYFGKIVGTAVRHNLHLALDMSPMLWRPLVRQTVSRRHLEAIDCLSVKFFEKIESVGLQLENEILGSKQSTSESKDDKEEEEEEEEKQEIKMVVSESGGGLVPEEWSELSFSLSQSESGGVKIPLVANGDEIPLTVNNWREFVQLAEKSRLKEGVSMYKVFRDGLSNVLPIELMPLFTSLELEQLVCGSSKVDVKLLKQCTEYEGIDPESALATHFWEVLEEMSDYEKTSFLRFVWARSRMPTSAQDLPMNFKLQASQAGGAKDAADAYLPHAQTCFFSLSLPAYSSKEILREKLLYAINNSPNMDADVRLHNAEGWADS